MDLTSPPAPANPSPVESPHNTYATQIPNPPSVTPKGDNDRPALDDVAQALNVCRSVEWSARAQIRKAAAVQRVIDGRPPFSPGALRAAGNAWQSNVSTGFLSSVVETVYPRLYLRLKSVKYLTGAKLEQTTQDPTALQRTADYRRIFTESVRSWPGWNIFLQGMCKEITTYGFGFPTFPDRLDWRPTMFRMDEAFIPQGTPIFCEDMQYYVVRQDWDAFDLYDKTKDGELAEDAGWNLQNCYSSIDNSQPLPRQITGLEIDTRRYQDLVREIIPASSYQKGWNLIKTYRIWTKESNGKCSERIINRDTGDELYYSENIGLAMKDIVLPMAFQYGNGTIYGSKGVGVILYEMACMVEKSRNRATDNLAQRNRHQLMVDPGADVTKLKMDVFAGISIISGVKCTPMQNTLADVSETMIMQDKYWTQIAQTAVGAYLPLDAQNVTEKTATQAKIDALQQNEKTNVTVDNMLTQFQMFMGIIARRICNPVSPDPVAQTCLKRMIAAGLSPQDIQYLTNLPPSENIVDFNDESDQQSLAYLVTLRGNPAYDQAKLERRISDIQLTAEIADEILLPVNDQSMVAENTRTQLLENGQLSSGSPMPVSARDNDQVHMAVMQGQQDPIKGSWNGPISQTIASGNLKGANAMMAHYATHLQAGQAKKTLGEGENNSKAFLAQMQQLATQAQQFALRAQMRQQDAANLSASVPPPPPQPQVA